MEARQHAPRGSSNVHRWLACPGSIEAAKGAPDTPSEAAAEGTIAHALVAYRLGREAKPGGVTPEMQAASDVVMDVLEGIALQNPGTPTELYVETPFAFPQTILPPDQVAGIADLMVYHPEDAEAWAIEFKYGMRPVEVERNPQLMFNACGLLWTRGVRKLNLVVIQPRVTWHHDGVVRTWSCDGVELVEFQAEVEAAIRASVEPNAPRIPGEHCLHCPVDISCPARVSAALTVAHGPGAGVEQVQEKPIAPEQMTDDRLLYVLRHADMLRDWLKAVENHMHRRAMGGQSVPGHKLVQARATRKWKAEPQVVAGELAAVTGLNPERFLRAEPITITEAEKVVTEAVRAGAAPGQQEAAVRSAKEKLAWLAPRAESGTLVLVPDTDPRPAASRLDAFKGVNILPPE